MRHVIIFGTGQWAELAHYYFTHDSPHEVVAFTLDRDYLDDLGEPTFQGLPVVAFEEVREAYPPDKFAMFIPISFKRMNHVRSDRFALAKDHGYELVSYVSSRATTFADFTCGENCFILEDNTIQPFVTIGDDVVLWSGNHIGHHSTIGDHVMVTSQVVISGACTIGPHSFFGVNATVRDETVVGRETLVGAAVAIMADTEPFSVYKTQGAKPAGFRSDEIRSLSHKSGG